ncbi:hypothetical protein GCK32_006714 [Trichostrongylus colubriformis]|uniref:Uncharacterized protein n=1 Tax=Trichostrongylus colubriformis TaxID=6319 RepID=A0AAN8ENH9_TRICO
MRHELLLVCIHSIFLFCYSLVYERPEMSAVMKGVRKCTVGRLSYSSVEQHDVAVKIFKNHSNSIGICQVALIYPENYDTTCQHKLVHDIVLRVVYIPKEMAKDLRPWCIVGEAATWCYCSGENCFTDPWSVIVFLLEVYRTGPSSHARAVYSKFREEHVDKASYSRTKRERTFHCLLKELRSKFKLGKILPEILTPEDAKVGADWNLFDDKVRNRIAEMSKKGDENEEPAAESSRRNERRRKMKTRFDAVVIIVVVLNVLCLVILAAFFRWYRGFIKRELQLDTAPQQVVTTSAEETPAKKRSAEEEPPVKKKKSKEDQNQKEPPKKQAVSSAEPVPGASSQVQNPPPPPQARQPLPGVDPYFW